MRDLLRDISTSIAVVGGLLIAVSMIVLEGTTALPFEIIAPWYNAAVLMILQLPIVLVVTGAMKLVGDRRRRAEEVDRAR